ncbi:MAG: polysaccharide biosynthesis tyrosine autokinase [bacterium]|nr:polysaccharide biosynthesis tyrosine autokinase [bacterium]
MKGMRKLFINRLFEKRKVIYIILIISLLLGTVTSFIFNNKKYVASTVLLVKSKNPQEEFVLNKNIFNTYLNIIKNNTTYEEMNNSLSMNNTFNELNNSISISKLSNSNNIEIKVKYKNEKDATNIALELSDIFIERINKIYEDVEVVNIDLPHIVGEVNDINKILIILLFITLGLVISAIYILISIKTEERIKTLKEIENDSLLKPLVEIPLIKNKKNKKKINKKQAFDNLRIKLQFLNVNSDSKKSLLIVSPNKEDGKSYVSQNLAISYAQSGKKVVLIDADMDTGVQSKLFNVPNNLGFSNYLSDLNENGIEIKELLNKFIRETSIDNLNLITSGTIPPNSQELLSNKIGKLVKELSTYFDIIIIDGTAVLNKAESLILSRFVDSTLIITDAKKTKKLDLWNVRRDIQNVGGKIIGVSVNKVKVKNKLEFSIFSKLFKTIYNLFKRKYIDPDEIKLLPEAQIQEDVQEDILEENTQFNDNNEDDVIIIDKNSNSKTTLKERFNFVKENINSIFDIKK